MLKSPLASVLNLIFTQQSYLRQTKQILLHYKSSPQDLYKITLIEDGRVDRKNEYQMNNASIGEIRGSINQIMHKDPYQREATKASFSKRLDFANVTKV